ncbi:MAG: Cys-tRNA(Pro) deacylase [Pseudomonadales bacterium]
MTPAVKALKSLGVWHALHSYQHDANCQSYGEEAATLLGQDSRRVFKTLLVCEPERAKHLFVVLVPVAQKLDLKAAATALKCKKVEMADAGIVQKVTGYVVGGISPLGQRKKLPTVIDNSAQDHESIYISAGKRGLELELRPQDLAQALAAHFADIAK